MSTYVNSKIHDYSDCPDCVKEFLYYNETIRNLSSRTINAYYIDLRTFFKFIVQHRGLCDVNINLIDVDIKSINIDFVKSVSKAEIYEFLHYATRERSNSAATRARKLSALKGFFKYICTKANLLKDNPCDDIDTPKLKQRLPKYLSLEESMELLKTVNSDFYERDYCIITLFLNCGMRLSELVGINLNDIKDNQIRIIGKGNKERMVYLNDACSNAIGLLINERKKLMNIIDKTAVFVSKRTGKRLSARRVQQIVEGCLAVAGLAGKGYSTHKLRHTAATLMYRFGNVDMLALKEILGHEHVSTTEIYTHISEKQLEQAAKSTPLAKVSFEKPNNK